MAEIVQDENPRRNLYRLLLADKTPGVGDRVKKYSFTEFENRLLTDEDTQNKMGWYLESKGIVADPVDFSERYLKTTLAPPTPKPQAAPKQEFMEAPSLEEQEAYVPETQPLVGSPEYDKQLQKQYGGMAPTLGATFGGVPAAFETEEQKKQEQISPAFKAQQLAFEDVPIAEEQRRSQKQFAKATKQQQQAAIQGGTGFKYEQERRRKERGYGEAGADLAGTIAAGGKRIGENIVSTLSNYINGTLRAGLPEIEATDSIEELANYELYNNATKAQNSFQDEVAKRNIQTSVLDAIEKGEYGKIPEATLYTIGDAAMQIIPAILTMGGSTYFQTLPQAYKDGVDAIAKEEGLSPEQVVASGKDAKVVAQISSGIQSGLEFAGANLVSSSIASRGGYKVMRDWLLGQGVNRNLSRGASLLGVGIGEGVTEYLQEGTGQTGAIAAKSPTTAAFFDNLPKELFTPEAKKQRREAFVGGLIGGAGVGGGGQAIQSAMDRTLFEAPKIGKATQRPDMDIVLTDDKIQQRNRAIQAMESAIQANPEAEGQIREQYQKKIDEITPTEDEVLNAYDGIAQLPPSAEKDRMLQDLEAYMAEKGIQPEATGIEAGLGEGLRVTSPVIQTVNPDFPAPQPPAPAEESIAEETPAEETSLEDQLMGLVPQEEAAPAPAEEEVVEVAPAEEAPIEEVAAEEEAPQPKAGDFVIVNGEKGVVVVTPGGQMSVETDTKIYDLDERGIAAIGGRLVAPKEQTQTEYEVEVIDDDNAVVNGEPFKIIRDEKGNTIALQGETRTIRTEPVMVDVDIKRNKAQVTETLQEQAEEVESLSPDMTLDKQRFVDDIIGQNMTEGVDRILSEGVTEKTAEKDLLQFKLFVEATIADLRARQKGNPYAEAMIEQLQEALNTVYYEYYSQGRKAETRAAKTQKKTDRGTKGKERVSPKPAEGKQPAAPVTPAPAAPKKQEAPKPEPKKEEAPKTEAKPSSTTPQAGSVGVGGDVELKNDIGDRKSIIYKGEKVGYVEVPTDLEGDTISLGDINIKPEFRNKGIGVEVYKILIKQLDKPLESLDRTPEAKRVWDSLLKQGLAKKEGNRYVSVKAVEQFLKGTPQEGATVQIAPQREGGSPRKMVFKDGEWKQNVGGDMVKVGPSVQQQAQEAFGGKAEVKPAETKEGKKAEAKEEKKETSFKGIASFETAKGSVYTVLPDGRTQRFKTATKEQNEPQDLTVFVKFKDAAQEQDFLEGVQRSETSGTKVYVIDKQGNKYDRNEQAAGKDVRLALVKDGKVIDTAETSTTPKIGYNTFDQRRFEKDGEKYRQAHLGNKVVKINEQTKTEVPIKNANSILKKLNERQFEKEREYEQVQRIGEETREGKSTPKTERVVRPKAKPIRNAGKTPDAIAARNIIFYSDPFATSLQYLMDATYHPDLLERIFGGPSKTTKSGRKDISGERRSRIQFLDNNSNVKTADKLAEVLAERYAEGNSIDVKDAEQQHDFASIATDIVSSYSSRSQMVRELLRLNDQQSEAFDFMYNPEEIYGEGYNEDIAKDIDGILDELPDSYWEGKEISDEDFGNLFAEEVEPITKAEKKYAKSKEEGGELQVNETPNGVPYLSQSGGAEYEVPNGLQWEGNKLGGNFLDVISIWNETNYINFNGGAYVKDASDVAEIMSLLENKSVEHSFAVHVDENEVPHIQFLNIGITSAAHFNAQAVLAGVKKFNSKKVYLVHNHPSGNLKLSEQDKKVTQNAQKLLEPLGVVVNHVVLNTYKKEYSVYENFDGMYLTTEGIPRKKDGGKEKLTTHIFNEQKVLSVPQKIVKSSQDAATFIQQIRLTALPKNAVLLLSQSNEIIGNYVFPDNINYKELTDIISESGIVQGLIFYGNQNNIAEISEIKERLSNATIRVLDLLIVSSDSSSIVGYYESAADQGLLNDVQEKYGTNSVPSPSADFTSKQESSASQEFDGMKKPSKIKTKSFDGKHGKGAFERMKNITDNFEDIMDGLSEKIKQDCL